MSGSSVHESITIPLLVRRTDFPCSGQKFLESFGLGDYFP